jgi:ATP-dependent exoDNAse (exonuclease V) alpha subunit
MIGTRQMARVIKKVSASGAKIVLVGDPEQLQPINAGTPFRDICNALDPAKLTEIHRQQEDWQKKASLDLAQLNTENALQAYKANGHVVETPNTETAILSLVEDYMVDLELHGNIKSRLALAHRRKDVHTINQAVRSAIKSRGGLTNEVLFTTDHGKRAFAKGDRIIFTKNDRPLGVSNGMLGTVKSVKKGHIDVVLDKHGQFSCLSNITINPKQYSSFDHSYAATIHKSQGATVDHTYVLGSYTMDKHLIYVAMTRHKCKAILYADGMSIKRMTNPTHKSASGSSPRNQRQQH